MRKRGHFIYLLEMHLSISKYSTLLEHYQIDGNKEAIVEKRLLHQQLLCCLFFPNQVLIYFLFFLSCHVVSPQKDSFCTKLHLSDAFPSTTNLTMTQYLQLFRYSWKTWEEIIIVPDFLLLWAQQACIHHHFCKYEKNDHKFIEIKLTSAKWM